jgi:hypothetical protein
LQYKIINKKDFIMKLIKKLLLLLIGQISFNACALTYQAYYKHCGQMNSGMSVREYETADPDPDQIMSNSWKTCTGDGKCPTPCADRSNIISGGGQAGEMLEDVCKLMCATREFITKQCKDNDTQCLINNDWKSTTDKSLKNTGDYKRKKNAEASVISDKTYFLKGVTKKTCDAMGPTVSEWRWVRSIEYTDIIQRLVNAKILEPDYIPRKAIGDVTGISRIVLRDPACPTASGGTSGPCDRFFERGDVGCCCANREN